MTDDTSDTIWPEPRKAGGASPDPTRSRLLELLEAAGYRVHEVRREWAECLLTRDRERWFGRGVDAADAMRAAVAQALPSQLGWELMLDALSLPREAQGEGLPAEADDAASTGPLGTGAADLSTAEAETGSASHEAPAPSADAPTDEASPRQAETPADSIAETPAAAPDATSLPTPVEAPVDAGPPEPATAGARPARPTARRLPKMSPREAIEALDDLRKVVGEERHVEFARWTPPRQRLFLLAAVTEGRAIVEAAGEDGEVFGNMAGLAGFLSALAGSFWPGQITALHLDCLPGDCAQDLGVDPSKAPRSWLEATEMAEARLDEIIGEAEALGFDEDGWADASETAPAAPEDILNEVVNLIEAAAGPLEQKPGFVEGGSMATFERMRRGPLLEAARKLRWLRHAPVDPERWGRAMGHLRFLAERAPREFDPLGRVVQEDYAPPGGWALSLGIDPDKRAKQRAWKDLLQSHPGGGSGEELHAWLLKAFDLPHASTPKLARFLWEHRECVLAIASESFSEDRRHRKRLTKLQASLQEPDPPKAGAATVPEELEGELPPAEPARPAEHQAMLDAILPHTEGKRVLLVTNRADPEQDAMLAETFRFARLRHEESTKSKLSSYKKSIAQGALDFVIVATGFQSHAVDKALKPEAQKAGVHYIRAHRARKLDCIRALHRDLGLAGA